MFKSKAKLALVVSDLHIGSTVGLWPESYTAIEGHTILPNKFQQWLWTCWLDMQKWSSTIIGNDEYEVIINGDLVEGQHHRTLQIMTADVGDQSAAVQQVLEPFISKAVRTHVILGTECHTRNDEMRIGRVLGASKDPSTGQHAWNSLDIEFNGTLCNVAHHISATARPYLEASAHSIALGALTMNRARSGKRIPSVMIRAHRHRHGVWNDGNLMSLICGAWQGLTRHGWKVVPDAVVQPSAVILDWRNVAKGDLPTVHQKVYTAS
jgi:hypothetical protein